MTLTEIFFPIIAFLLGFGVGQYLSQLLWSKLATAQRDYIAALKGQDA